MNLLQVLTAGTLAVSMFLGALACRNSDATGPRQGTCVEQAAAAVEWLKRVDAQFGRFALSKGVRLVAYDGAEAEFIESSDVLEIRRDGFGPDDMTIPFVDSPRLDMMLRARKSQSPADSALLLAVDPEAPWAAILAAVASAQEAGYGRLTFLFARSHSAIRHPTSSIDGRLERITSELSLGKFAIDVVYAKCAAAHDALWGPESTPGSGEGRWNRLRDALAACDCNVDFPSLRALHFRELSGLGQFRALAGLTVTLAPRGDATRTDVTLVAGRRDASWSEASQRIIDAARIPNSVRFGVIHEDRGSVEQP